MSDKNNWTSLGDQIVDSVSNALTTGDFSNLNQLVSDTVNSAVEEAKQQALFEHQIQYERAMKAREEWAVNAAKLREKEEKRREEWQRKQQEDREKELQRQREWRQQQQTYQQENRTRMYQRAYRPIMANQPVQNVVKKVKKTLFKRKGTVSSILLMIFGSIGAMFNSFLSLAMLAVLIEEPEASTAVGLAFFVSMLLVGLGMLFGGIFKNARLQRAERYLRLLAGKTYISLSELATNTGKTIGFVKRDLRKMINKGIFPEGHLDSQETCFILDDETYLQYSQTAEAFRMKEEMNRKANEEKEKEEAQRTQNREEMAASALEMMISEGMDYTKKLRDLNDKIPDENLSADLSRLEKLLQEIFGNLREHPEQMDRMQKLMDYYLPTTVKLVEAYEQFDRVSVPGDNVKDAKKEIEKTLGVINDAFAEFQDKLFQAAAFDATTDAQVLQSMLAREGLTKEPTFATMEKKDDVL